PAPPPPAMAGKRDRSPQVSPLCETPVFHPPTIRSLASSARRQNAPPTGETALELQARSANYLRPDIRSAWSRRHCRLALRYKTAGRARQNSSAADSSPTLG